MAEKKTELDLKELEWQIKARARIQELMYDLYCFLEEYSEFPNEDPKRPPGEPADKQELCWTNMAWMVDAAFSLWRSAFLTDTVRDRKVVYAHMKDFIQRVLEVNTITFADDHRMRALSVGYYNANARYRLERLYTNNPELTEKPRIQKLDQLKKDKVDLAKRRQSDLWTIYCDALQDSFDWFKEDWLKHMRPGKNRSGPSSTDSTAVASADPAQP